MNVWGPNRPTIPATGFPTRGSEVAGWGSGAKVVGTCLVCSKIRPDGNYNIGRKAPVTVGLLGTPKGSSTASEGGSGRDAQIFMIRVEVSGKRIR